MRQTFFLGILLAVLAFSCRTNKTADTDDLAQVDGHPAWIMQGNIYEVNLRQYTAEGTINAFVKHLDRLKDMGVQTLWFMPIHPISMRDRKGALGSYYAVADYRAVNPEFGTMEDWKALVDKAHDMGFKVIIDWVPNHTGADHPWVQKHPEFYLKNKDGLPTHPPNTDWTDIRKLEYTSSPQVADSMLAAMRFWIRETGIDGFRVDVAGDVPRNVWTRIVPELKKEKNIFLLAESNDPWLHEVGFDATYTWDAFNAMKQIVRGERNAPVLDSILTNVSTSYPSNALRMYFTSNHDENSWNQADYGTMPKDVHAPFAVLTQTMKASVPLIYSGQEEPHLDSLSFFYKDHIRFGQFKRAPFYKALLQLRKNNPALAANAPFAKVETNMDYNIYAYMRQSGDNKVLVVLNLTATPQSFKIKTPVINGEALNIFTNQPQTLNSSNTMHLPYWGYAVYEYK